MSLIKQPNLPKNDVCEVLVSCEMSEKSEYTLLNYGISLQKTIPSEALYDAVKCHADMLFHHLSDDVAVAESKQAEYLFAQTPYLNICSKKVLSGIYPYDIAYNAARVGKYLICNSSYTDGFILNYAQKHGIEIIDVKQGYAKCNICIISENAVITSDIGIKSALGNFPVECLLIDDKSVLLKDFKHGFFGGATGKIAPDKLAVNGNIKYHNNAEEIISFAKKHSVEVISLNDGYIEDIGSILPILEK